MSRVDDRIRSELRRMPAPVDGRRAFERVDRRRRRLRLLRRVRLVTLTAAVVAGTIAAGIGLRAVLESSRTPSPDVTGPAPSASPRPVLDPVTLCWASSTLADLDGDGVGDRISIGIPLPDDGICRELRQAHYVARIELAEGTDREVGYEQTLPGCGLGQCWVFATPDLNDDGRDEIAIEHTAGASTANFSLYRFYPDDGRTPLHRLEVLPPGDPFDETFGIETGTTTFGWYGSVTHQHWISCGPEPEDRGLFEVVTALRDEVDSSLQRVHTTVLAVFRDGLTIEGSRDETVPDGSLSYPADLCGSALIAAPEPGDRLTVGSSNG